MINETCQSPRHDQTASKKDENADACLHNTSESHQRLLRDLRPNTTLVRFLRRAVSCYESHICMFGKWGIVTCRAKRERKLD